MCLERLIYACATPTPPTTPEPATTPASERVPGLRIGRGRRRVKDAPEVVTWMAVVPLVDREREREREDGGRKD